MPWGAAETAVQGIGRINTLRHHVGDKIEIVVGRGVASENVALLYAGVIPDQARLSVHAYSSVLKNGITSTQRVAALVSAANDSARGQQHVPHKFN